MGARQSPEMDRAQELVTKRGYTQYAAAVETGITRGAISKSRWYRDFVAKQAAADAAREARNAARRKGARK